MKILIVFFFSIIGAMSENCTSRLDCSHYECCVADYYTNVTQCRNLTDEGDSCFADFSTADRLDPIKLRCPCKSGLFCNTTEHVCQVQPEQPTPRICTRGDDCNEDECCVRGFYGGQATCQPLTKDVDECFTDLENRSRDDVFTGICPCMPGHVCYTECLEKSIYETYFKPYLNAVKERDEYQRANKCDTGKDCPEDQCCFYDPDSNLPGKKYCEPLLKEYAYCNEDLYESRTRDYVFTKRCPCSQGLVCENEDTKYVVDKQCRKMTS